MFTVLAYVHRFSPKPVIDRRQRFSYVTQSRARTRSSGTRYRRHDRSAMSAFGSFLRRRGSPKKSANGLLAPRFPGKAACGYPKPILSQGEKRMKSGISLKTHIWSALPRQIFQDGRTIAHQRCLRCSRDFALELDGSGWHAVYVGVFRVELLAEAVNRRWLSEDCPKKILPADAGDRAKRTAIGARTILCSPTSSS